MAAISSFQNMAASGVGVTSLFFAVPRASVRHAALGASPIDGAPPTRPDPARARPRAPPVGSAVNGRRPRPQHRKWPLSTREDVGDVDAGQMSGKEGP